MGENQGLSSTHKKKGKDDKKSMAKMPTNKNTIPKVGERKKLLGLKDTIVGNVNFTSYILHLTSYISQ